MNSSRIGHDNGCAASQPLNGHGTHLHINFRDMECRRHALSRWLDQCRSQLIGTDHLDTALLRVGMIERQRATPYKCIYFSGLPWLEVDVSRGLSTPIID